MNAGCRITSIQQLLGHQNINTTLVYARVYDKTVAEDYYTAMEVIEKKLEPASNSIRARTIAPDGANQLPCLGEHTCLLALLDTLRGVAFSHDHRETIQTLREGILALVQQG